MIDRKDPRKDPSNTMLSCVGVCHGILLKMYLQASSINLIGHIPNKYVNRIESVMSLMNSRYKRM